MPLQQVPISPGIVKETTAVEGEGLWVDGNNVRFVDGKPEKIKGWESISPSITGTPRGITAWQDLQGRQLLAVGTEPFLYLISGETAYNITPLDSEPSVDLGFVAADETITVTHAAHGREIGDYVYFDGAVTFTSGPDLDGYYKVTAVNSVNEYEIEWDSASPDTKAESSITVGYLIRTTEAVPLSGAQDFGEGDFGEGDFSGGTLTAGIARVPLTRWSLDNWGEDLIAVPTAGKVYQWDASAWDGVSQPDRAVAVSGAPDQNQIAVVLTTQRHLVLFGTVAEGGSDFDPLQIRWADRESLTTWNSLDTNRAGDQRIPGGVEIVGVVKTDTELLILTDNEAWAMEFFGGPAVFGFSNRGSHCGLIGQNAAVNVGGVAFWMSQDNFFIYNGTPQVLPCSVHDFVFDNLDRSMTNKIYAAYIAEHDEVWWFYQDKSSAGDNNRCVVYNVGQQTWWIGDVPRTVMIDRGAIFRPIAFGDDGTFYQHETGTDADGSAINAHVTSGKIDLGDGEQIMRIQRMIPDFRDLVGTVEMSFGFSRWPQQDPSVKGPYAIIPNHNQYHFRGRGRFVELTVASNTTGTSWRMGAPRFDIKPDGMK